MTLPADPSHIEHLIRNKSENALRLYLVSYLSNSATINAELLIDLALQSADAYIVEETIKGLAYRYYDSGKYRALVWHGLNWPYQDTFHGVLLSSLNRLPKYAQSEEQMKRRLQSLVEHPDPFVRDVLAEIAQRALGVPDREIVRTEGQGTLLDDIDSKFAQWMFSS
jgi:hypothetical protein